LKCDEDGYVNVHLIEMVKLHDELAGMGASIGEEEFSTIILGLLPASYCTLLSTVTIAASLSGKAIGSDDLIHIILEEVNHQNVADRIAKLGEFALHAGRDKLKHKGKEKTEHPKAR
jgi:hypothetical protein